MDTSDPTINMTLNQLKTLYKKTKREDVKKILKNKINERVYESKVLDEIDDDLNNLFKLKKKEKAMKEAYNDLINKKNENNESDDSLNYGPEESESYESNESDNVDINRINTIWTKNIVNDKKFKDPLMRDFSNNRLLGRLETEIGFRNSQSIDRIHKPYDSKLENIRIPEPKTKLINSLGKRKNLR